MSYTLLFCIMSFLTRAILLATGRSVVWQYDSSGEYYPAIAYFVRTIRSQLSALLNGGPLPEFAQFDFSIGLGNDVISSLNFYGFGDPLILLLALLPIGDMETLFTLGVYLRQFLAGYFFYLYIRSMGVRRSYALVGAISYAFCAFVNHNTLRHQNFLNAAMYLPLVLLGYERLRNKRPALFIASIALLAASGFYFLYMISIFLFLYALARFFREHPRGRRAASLGRVFFSATGCYLIGLCLAGAMLLPSVYGYLNSARLERPLQLNLLFYPLSGYMSILSRYVFPQNAHYETIALWAFLAVLALVLHRKWRKQLAPGWVYALIAFYLICPFAAYLFNGFSYVSPRSTFLLSFLSSCVLSFMIDRLMRLKRSDRWVMSIAVALLYAAFAYTLFQSKDLSSKRAYYLYLLVMGCEAAAVPVVLWFLNRPAVRGLRWAPVVAALALVTLNLGINDITYAYWRYQGGQLLKSGSVDRMIASSPGSSVTKLADDQGFYRVEIPGRELSVRNESLMLGYNPTACYLSIQNAANLDELTDLEDIARIALHYSTGLNDRSTLMSLLNVRYYATDLGSPQAPPYGFNLVMQDDRHAVYKNMNELPLGYSTQAYITPEAYDQLDGLGKQQALLHGAVLHDTRGLRLIEADWTDERTRVPYEIARAADVTWSQGVLNVAKAGAEMKLSFRSVPGCETYLRLVNLNVDDAPYDISSITVSGDGFMEDVYTCSNTVYEYNHGAYNYLVNMGYRAHSLTEATLTFDQAGEVYLDDIEILCLPMQSADRAIEALGEAVLENVRMSANRIDGDVDFSSDRVLILGIPYAPGWRAEVDGQPYPLDPSNGLTMALALPAGHHRISLKYENPWLKPGMILSALGLVCATAVWAASRHTAPAKWALRNRWVRQAST